MPAIAASNHARPGPPVHCTDDCSSAGAAAASKSGSGASYTAKAASGRAGSDGAWVAKAGSNAAAAS
jgi:hypothetical protein